MDRGQRTGLVLAGGRGQRMGGVDKALVRHAGRPLLAHVLERLAPQVGALQVVTAHGQALPGFADPALRWLADPPPAHRGPMAGVLAGLEACRTPWLLTVPCDAPALPPDLAERLAEALGGQHLASVACTRGPDGVRMEPVFSLLHVDLAPSLAAALAAGERAPQRWLRSVGAAPVTFEDATGFFNANTPQDLQP